MSFTWHQTHSIVTQSKHTTFIYADYIMGNSCGQAIIRCHGNCKSLMISSGPRGSTRHMYCYATGRQTVRDANASDPVDVVQRLWNSLTYPSQDGASPPRARWPSVAAACSSATRNAARASTKGEPAGSRDRRSVHGVGSIHTGESHTWSSVHSLLSSPHYPTLIWILNFWACL